MKNLSQQTKQAFYFSLISYVLGGLLFLIKQPFAPIMVSVSLLLSLIWVFLVLREVMYSIHVTAVEKALLVFFIIFFNIIAGIIYFSLLREKVIGKQKNSKI